MKARLLALFVLLVGLALLLTLLPSGTLPAAAQRPQPTPPALPYEPSDGGRPYQTKDGLWVMPAGASPRAPAQVQAPKATGGPDQYGYTWNDAVALSWIDATGGTDTGMSGSSYGQKVGPIPLPFSFKYYENTYTSLYIAASGYLGFTDYGTWPAQSQIPSTSQPNNVIAPYWTPIYLNSTGPSGRVYYTSGGVAPNRYFVAEWYDVTGGSPSDTIGRDELYRFEVILYENGDIVFQYQTMNYVGSYYCGAAGIEDSTGLDGLAYGSYCSQYAGNKAVRFYRPAPSARVNVYPLYQGRFSTAGALASFQVSIRNIGELGADTYDLITSSTWPVSLYAADGTTPLTDTNSNGLVDTGSLAQGSTVTITVKVQTPSAANVGDANTATVTARSSLNVTKQKTTTLQTAIPATFAQVYRDNADGAMSLYLVQPGTQVVKKTTADGYSGSSPAIAEMPSSFAYFWTKFRNLGSVYVGEIEYTLLDHLGNTTRAVTKLGDLSGATMNTYDSDPTVAVAPNGRIGVLWYHYLWNSGTSQFNYNIYFAILDASGSLVYGPLNLTNNALWGTWSDLNVPGFWSPRIAATGDNRFVLAWRRYHQSGSSTYVYNIWYAVRDTNGSLVKDVTQLTGDGASSLHSANTIPGNGAILTWLRNWDIYYAVLDSAGNLTKAEANLTNNGQGRWSSDAVALSDGKTAVVWTNYDGTYVNKNQLAFAILDTSFNRITGLMPLNNPIGVGGNTSVSAAAEAAGRAVFTWTDATSPANLYYALVNSTGTTLTQPMIFRTSQASSPYIATSSSGYGNTAYHPFRLFLPLILR